MLIALGLCGCDKKTPDESCSEEAQTMENYFGGSGKITLTNGVLRDDTNFYFGWGILKKFNKETKTFSVACQIPGCDHGENPNCKANINNSGYTVFNGRLIKKVDRIDRNNDGTSSSIGCLYLCDENKRVFENTYPDSFTDEQKKTSLGWIGVILPLDDDNLAVICSGFMYILDTDFNIRCTVFDMGPYSGGIYSFDGSIYYINDLYRLMKLDMETGAASEVDLGSMKVTEGVLCDGKLWFSNEIKSLCSYDFKSGEIKEHAKNAVRLALVGNYIEYLIPSYSTDEISEVRLFNIETGEDVKCPIDDININLYDFDGEIYSYEDDKLVQRSTDLMEVLNEYTAEDQ